LLEKELRSMFGKRVLYIMHHVEFQQRGMPHAHILIKFACGTLTPSDIDNIVSAELPHDEPDRSLVQRYMIHHHPPPDEPPSSYCQKEDAFGIRHCRFHYPRPLQPATTIDDLGRVHYKRTHPDDAMVVPCCLPLLRAFECHMNFEVAASSHLFQYLFKYINKSLFFFFNSPPKTS